MEKEKNNFMDDLLEEAEQKEEQLTESYYDLVLLEIKNLNQKIESNFREAEKECEIIKNWALARNNQLNDKVKFLELKLEAFIKERKEKTIDLPNGTLKFHKKQDKVEIEDLELFLKNAKPELVTVIPEQIKPNLVKIKSYIAKRPIPPGIRVTEGKEEFTYKIKGAEYGRKEETGAGAEQENVFRVVV